MAGAVLDSYAILALLFGEPGDARVVERLEAAADAREPLLVAAPNWAEVCYQVERRAGALRWPDTRDRLLALPLSVMPADRELAERAGALKATRRMSLADCFAAALAQAHDAELLTGDPEFRAVEREIRIVWL